MKNLCCKHTVELHNPWTEILLSESFLQEIIAKGRTLTDNALKLSDTKECNPEEICTLARDFEEQLADFSSRLTEKRETLEMAKSFFKCSDQVRKRKKCKFFRIEPCRKIILFT